MSFYQGSAMEHQAPAPRRLTLRELAAYVEALTPRRSPRAARSGGEHLLDEALYEADAMATRFEEGRRLLDELLKPTCDVPPSERLAAINLLYWLLRPLRETPPAPEVPS